MLQSWAGSQKREQRACISQPRQLLRASCPLPAMRPSGGDAYRRVLLKGLWPSAQDSTTSCTIPPNRLISFVLPLPPLRPRRPLLSITDCLLGPLLPLQPPPLRPPRQHDYTCEHPSGQAYIAMYNGRQFGGLHVTDRAAAKAVADFLGIDFKTLQREPPITHDIASRLFMEMFSIYVSAGTPRRSWE